MLALEKVRLRRFLCPRCSELLPGSVHGFHCTEEEEKKYNFFYVNCDGMKCDGFNGKASGERGQPKMIWISKAYFIDGPEGVSYYILPPFTRNPVIGR